MQETIVIRVAEEEKKRLKKNAEQSGMKFSEYIRFVLQGCPASGHPEVVSEMQQLRVDIARIGNNINQITRAQNAYLFSTADKESLNQDMRQIQGLLAQIVENLKSNGETKYEK